MEQETFEEEMRARLDDLHKDVKFLRETVERLLGGMVDAQQSSGMAGMMARQMLPDMSAFAPAPYAIPQSQD